MPRISKIVPCFLMSLLLLPLIARGEESSSQKESTKQFIEFLIHTVEHSNLTFIRNGEKYTCNEAAMYVRNKYDYCRSQIKTPEDFINFFVSKSLMSGQSYQVVTEQGTIPAEKWLEQKLADYVRSRENS